MSPQGVYRLASNKLYNIINPRRACAARVTVLGLCVCVCVCPSVCLHLFSTYRDQASSSAIPTRDVALKQATKPPTSSLVPRPFPPPVFDRLQCANTEGEDLVTCGYVRYRQKVDTRGAVPDEESRRPFLYNRSEGWRPER